MGKQTTLAPAPEAPAAADELPALRNVIVDALELRIEVYVQGIASGWIVAWNSRRGPSTLPANSNDRTLWRALERFQRWRQSIRSQSPRARQVGAQGVRLIIGEQVACAFAESEEVAQLARVPHRLAKPVPLAAPDQERIAAALIKPRAPTPAMQRARKRRRALLGDPPPSPSNRKRARKTP